MTHCIEDITPGRRMDPGCHHGPVLLADVVAASTAVAATRSRTAKAGVIAELLRRAAAGDVEPVTA